MQLPRLRAVIRAYLISIAFWCGMALLMGLQYKPPDPHNFWPSLADLVVQVAAHAFGLAFWTPPIFYLVQKYISFAKYRVRYVVLWGFGAIPYALLHTGLFWLIMPPYDEALHRYVSRSLQYWIDLIRGGFADEVLIYVSIVVAAHAYEFFKRVRREEAEKYEYQQALAASELQALKMQLQPHFLFNTLHGIATLIDSDGPTAKAMIVKLSNLLRIALERSSSDLIALEDELRFAREYLDLEQMRFGNRLNVEWRIAPETSRLLVPQMVLQPLVENAIRYGIAPAREGGWVEIAIVTNNGSLNIQVRNTTSGKTSNGTGVGLKNIEARLKYLYSGEASLGLTFEGNRTAVVKLSIPAIKSQPSSPEHSGRAVLEKEDSRCAFSSSTTNP
jgi:histidine kinase